ncbi:MAG: hypothetical protein ACO38V_08390, partial [Phycisphaerales bacterium]
MRDRRPVRFERHRAHRSWPRIQASVHRRRAVVPDLVEEILGDLGWRRIDRMAQRLRRGLRAAFLVAAVAVAGSIAVEAADRAASGRAPGRLDEAIRNFGEVPSEWRDADWAEWMGGV